MTDISEREKMARIIVAARFNDIQECVDMVFDGNHTTENAQYEKQVSLGAADRLIAAGYKSMPVDQDKDARIRELEAWQELVFEIYGNIDLDIERLKNAKSPTN